MCGFIKARHLSAKCETIDELADLLRADGYSIIRKDDMLAVLTEEACYIFYRSADGKIRYRRIIPGVEFATNGGSEGKPWLILWTTVEETAKPKTFYAKLRLLVSEETVRLWTVHHSCVPYVPPPIAVRRDTMSGIIETDGQDVSCPAINEQECSIGDTVLKDWWQAFDIRTATYVDHETGRGHLIEFSRLSHEDAHLLGIRREDWWELVEVLRPWGCLDPETLTSVSTAGGRLNALTGLSS